MPKLRTLISCTVLLALAGAALYLYAAHRAGRAELRALCEQGVEPKVYRKVSAEGYFDGGVSCLRNGCWDVLTKSGFRYIEVEQRDAQPWDPLPENGYYRLSKVRQDSGLCDVKILEEMKKAFLYEEYIAGGNCIRKEKLGAPEAAYGIFSEKIESKKLSNFFGSVIAGRHTSIRTTRERELVAERTNYLLYQHSLPSFSSFENVLGCPDVGVSQTAPDVTVVEAYLSSE